MGRNTSILLKRQQVVSSYSIEFTNYNTSIVENQILEIGNGYGNIEIGKIALGLDVETNYLFFETYRITENYILLKSFDFSLATTVNFEMQHYFKQHENNLSEGNIEYSLDSKTWHNINTFTETTENPHSYSVDLSSELAGVESNVIFRLKYNSERIGYFWCIGSINITSS